MSLNWREIDQVIGELDAVGSHIQQVVQPDYRNVYLHLFRPDRRQTIRICLESGRTRIHSTREKPRKPETRQRFEQFLRARIKGGKITQFRQVNCDRIVRIDVVRAEEVTTLWIRLWGGAANIIATSSSGEILDAFFRRPARGEVTGGHYDVPDDPQKVATNAEKLETFQSRFAGTADINAAVDSQYHSLENDEQRDELVARVRKRLEQRLSTALTKLDRARNRFAEGEGADRDQLYGEMILSSMHSISQGDAWVELQDFSDPERTISIELDPKLSPQANAESYFTRARKARKRADGLNQEIADLKRRSEGIRRDLEELDSWSIDRLRDELAAQTGGAAGTGETTPGLQFESHGFRILVGRTAKENDELLRRWVRGNDLWLHTRDYPGGYVFIKSIRDKSVPLEVLLDAGNLAVHFSKARSGGGAELYYTQVKYLRRAKGGPTGLVLPTQEKNLSVRVESARLDRLLG